jgi:hypothetical protein
VLGCGGGSGVGAACSAAAARVFSQCDLQSPTDQGIIGAALAGFGFDFSNAEIAATSQGELAEFCDDELEGSGITGSEADEFADQLNGVFGCQNVVNTIVDALNDL